MRKNRRSNRLCYSSFSAKKQNNNKINIEYINDFDKNSEDHQDHTYAKKYKVIKFWS